MPWKLPDGTIIQQARPVIIAGIHHPAKIFSTWSAEKLAAIGIKPVVEQAFDADAWESTGVVEEEVDGIIYRTHQLSPRVVRETPIREGQPRAQSLPTQDLEILDAGIHGATEAAWIKARIGGKIVYLRGHAAK